jgi:ribosome-binding ATPase YchF (GTP1/OBG family)
MPLIVGIVGKPSSGKSTFLNAACLTDVKVSELPFTTIDPNKGIAYVKTKCVCGEMKVKDDPKNSTCIDGFRFIPINLLDVAGLVPDAHIGKGLGNKFLNDLAKADVLIHIIDASGALDKMGKAINGGKKIDPYEDVLFLENEINLWFKDMIEREDWDRFKKALASEKRKIVEELFKRLSGVKVKKNQIISSLRASGLENKNPGSWINEDLEVFSRILREISKPILLAANKIDKEKSAENLNSLENKCNSPIIPCSALAEHVLRKYDKKKVIRYIPGSNDFQIINKDKLNTKEIELMEKIKENILKPFTSTGVQKILNHAVFEIAKQICVYPVSDVNSYSDNNNNILPDVFLVKKGTLLRDFVGEKIHSDLAEHFMFGIDARTKKRLGENYELKHNDIIKIVTSR